jgi:hypothetical protein
MCIKGAFSDLKGSSIEAKLTILYIMIKSECVSGTVASPSISFYQLVCIEGALPPEGRNQVNLKG